jgi:Lysyl oxidase
MGTRSWPRPSKLAMLALRFLAPRRVVLLLAAASAVLLIAAASAQAAVLLPDLEQEVPTKVGIDPNQVNGSWAISFQSDVANVGQGPLEVRGHRDPGQANMTASQWANIAGSTSMQDLGVVGDLHFQVSHDHWHFEPFDHYELRRLDGSLAASDVKQGFCLGDNEDHGGGPPHYTEAFNGYCAHGNTGATDLIEGISVGWADFYEPNLEGQDIPINPSSAPSGDYILVHRVNENPDRSPGPVHEVSYANNVASLHIHINWSGGTPSISSQSSPCSGSPSCDPAPIAAPAPPPQQPQAQDKIAPNLTFSGRTSERFTSRASSVFLFASCSERCALTAQGTVSVLGSKKAARTGTAKLTLAPGKRGKVVLSVSRKLRRTIRAALKHGKRVRVRVRVTVVDAAGNTRTSTRVLRLVG